MKFLLIFVLLFCAAIFATHSVFQQDGMAAYLHGKQQANMMLFDAFAHR